MNDHPGRRKFLALGAAMGGALAGCSTTNEQAEEPSTLGKPVSRSGQPSSFETAERLTAETETPEAAASRTPLASTFGMITPASLHFERHHSGVPAIDPAEHKLLIHGLVDRPLVLTMEDIKRLPSVSRIHFVECSGNSRSEWGPRTARDVQRSHGLASCSEWTGVTLRLLFAEVGVQPQAQWFVAEGADPCHMSRSVPIAKAMDDALVVYGQNGEALRPEQGYPLRLLLPGYEGNINVKWLRRIKLLAEPAFTKDETSKYTDLLPDGKARMFTLDLDAKSVITSPSGGQTLAGSGFHEIRGLAWSGRGAIRLVEVSTDGGATWADATLQQPVLPKAFTPFRLPWRWDGSETTLVSRAIDETGYVQPSVEELIAARGMQSGYHNNGQKEWRIAADGSVNSVDIAGA